MFHNTDAPEFYPRLHRLMSNGNRPPMFVCINDLTGLPTKEALSFHAEQLTKFFEAYWPTPAPWEIRELTALSPSAASSALSSLPIAPLTRW
jgi:hypothetical protein